jgi:hypothetical protein
MTSNSGPRWPIWPWLVLTIAGVGITAAAAIVGAVVSSESDTDPSGPPTVTVTEIQIQPSTVTRTVTATVPPGPTDQFDDGLFEVGVDVVPGTFRTDGPDGSNASGCYWSHIAPTGEVIANGKLTEPGTVTVGRGDLFDTAGCRPWERTA